MNRITISLMFLCIYPSLIFSFAYCYSRMPHSFYESNIKYELAYSDTTKSLTAKIVKSLYRPPCQPAASENDPFCLDENSYQIDLGDGKSGSISNFSSNEVISVSDSAIVLPVFDNVTLNNGPAASVHFFVKIVSNGFDAERPVEILSDVFSRDKFMNTSGLNVQFVFRDQSDAASLTDQQWRNLTKFIVESQFRAKIHFQSGNVISGYLALPGNLGGVDALVGRINAYLQASSGYTSDLDDNFGRMAYFSAVTITTVGFGDIVPITSEARQLVAIEAVVGIVLIGVFINLVVGTAASATPPNRNR